MSHAHKCFLFYFVIRSDDMILNGRANSYMKRVYMLQIHLPFDNYTASMNHDYTAIAKKRIDPQETHKHVAWDSGAVQLIIIWHT